MRRLVLALVLAGCSSGGPAQVPATTTTTSTLPPTTTTTWAPTTTTHTHPPTTTTTRVVRAASAGRPAGVYKITAYCLTGRMANGEHTHHGAAASNHHPIGTRLHVPALGVTVVVKDRSAQGSTDLDLAWPGECQRALQFGVKRLPVEVLP